MITLNKKDNIEFVWAGLFKSDGVWCHPRRIIDTYEIIFMCEGTAYICENGIEYILKKNDVLLLEPGTEHYGGRCSEEYVSFSWIHFRTDSEKYMNMPKNFSIKNPSVLKNLFSQCLHSVNTPGCGRVCADLYTALIAEEIISADKIGVLTVSYLAARISDYVTLNPEKTMSVQSVAAHFGYHENYINTAFKSAYGVTLKKYISEQRLAYAKGLLNTTLYTVNQISQMMSFKSENHFVKFFKYHTSTTPTEYRNAYINTHINKK